jgi:hypothetical protein
MTNKILKVKLKVLLLRVILSKLKMHEDSLACVALREISRIDSSVTANYDSRPTERNRKGERASTVRRTYLSTCMTASSHLYMTIDTSILNFHHSVVVL